MPGLWSNSVKSYFYATSRAIRQTGGANRPTLSIPSLKERSGRLQRLARRERQPDPDLRPGHDAPARRHRGKQPFPGNIIPANRITRIAQRLPAVPADAHERRRRSTTTSCRRAIPDTILGDTNYYFGPLRHLHRPEGPHRRSLWHQRAPAKFYSQLPHELATETYSDPQNSWVNRLQLGPHLRPEPAQPPDLRLPEPQRGLRLRQPGRRRRAAQDRGRRRATTSPPPDGLQRRLRPVRLQRRRQRRATSRRADLHPQRPRHLDQGQPHDQGRHRVPQHRRQRPHQRQRGGHRSPSAAAPPASSASISGSPIASFLLGRGGQRQRGRSARRRTPTRGSTPGSSTRATPGTPTAS